MDNPSSVLIDIHSLDSTPAEHDRNLTNKVSIIDLLDFESQLTAGVLTKNPSECHHEDLVQTRVIIYIFDIFCHHF